MTTKKPCWITVNGQRIDVEFTRAGTVKLLGSEQCDNCGRDLAEDYRSGPYRGSAGPAVYVACGGCGQRFPIQS